MNGIKNYHGFNPTAHGSSINHCDTNPPIDSKMSISTSEMKKKSPGIVKILTSAFFFAVIISLLISLVFGILYLNCRFTPQELSLAFFTFYMLWLIGYFSAYIYDICTKDFDNCVAREMVLGELAINRDSAHRDRDETETEITQSRVQSPTTSDYPLVIPGNSVSSSYELGQQQCQRLGHEIDRQIRSAKARKSEIENKMLGKSSLVGQGRSQYSTPGASKLSGLCPPMPGSDRVCGPPDCKTKTHANEIKVLENESVKYINSETLGPCETPISPTSSNKSSNQDSKVQSCCTSGNKKDTVYKPCGSGNQNQRILKNNNALGRGLICNYFHTDN